MGKQYDKHHAMTVIPVAALSPGRFIGFDGTHATSAGGSHDSAGVSETEGAIGQPTSVITSYSAPVEAGAIIAKFDFIKPAADGSGKAIVGTATDNCGMALEAAGAIGQFFEARILPHRHT